MRDIDIRKRIKESILKKYYADDQSRVVDELNVSLGAARVDIAVINGSMHAYEIKSEVDTLYRLPKQIVEYSKTFDYITVVSGNSHIDDLVSTLPSFCGIMLATKGRGENQVVLKTIRRATRNTSIQKYSIAQLLWKNEVIDILTQLGENRPLLNKNKAYLWKLLADSLDVNPLSHQVRTKLKVRENWKSD